ncbi:MAG: hypothetical protein A3K19_05825 [Lentisphaerae bacterium RIFOXYB12_FULL_65_16]|nr:MAG: hypothetical protein A3K18_15440 [Lentisphaerae bacterium RIFOXYA12_64_32]OGV95091.1 MAG: hypothetical protein A3K19_05825 [Lentisphaerae bacterium RIFOXYB12_FULL_65_16]
MVAGCHGAPRSVPGNGPVAGPATHYVDAARGDDDRDGRDPARAWRSLAKVNAALLAPGDTVLFKRGEMWRGQLIPRSGDASAPVTYAAYGEGDKPLLLGSVAKTSPDDWAQQGPNIWSTRETAYVDNGAHVDFTVKDWNAHDEKDAKIAFAKTAERLDGTLSVYRLDCTHSGAAGNHIQLNLFPFPVQSGQMYELAFRARGTAPFVIPNAGLIKQGPPYSEYGTGHGTRNLAVTTEWRRYVMRFTAIVTAGDGRIAVYLGRGVPAGQSFFFAPETLHRITCSGPAPLDVDVGNIIFDHGKATGWKKWKLEDLKQPYDYWYDAATGTVKLCLEKNPATAHASIELALNRHVVNQGGKGYVIYDGLGVRYGAAHGFGGGNTHHLIIRNCDVAYIGGGHQFTTPEGRPVRFGNGIEFWGAAHDNLVEGCRLWEIYDAALTNQGRGPDSKEIDITYRNNVIWNSEYSFEYWNNPETAETRNIRFLNNTCVNAGIVWSHAQRPDRNGSHLMFYSNTAVTSGIEIKYNIFCQVTEWGSRYERGWKPLPDMDYNVWFSTAGVMTRFFGKKIEPFDEYQRATGLDAHSVFADPKFVDAANADFRLAPDSPARTLRADGGSVGALP